MKEKILNTLILANNLNERIQNKSNNRISNLKADVVTQGDLQIGDFLIKKLLDSPELIVIESEERGKQRNFDTTENEDFYIAIDDIDGSNNLRVGDGVLPYCSMIVVFDGKNKNGDSYRFSDYKYAACIDYVSKRIFYTERGLGRVEQYDLNGQVVKISADNFQDNDGLALTLSTDIVSSQRGGSVGYAKAEESEVSVLPSLLDGVYKNYAIVDSGCSVFEYAMIGMGIRNGYVSSGKKMHELPLLYAFSKESGKEMCNFEGKPFDGEVYDFNGKNLEVISGSPLTIKDVMDLIRRQKIANERLVERLKVNKDKKNVFEEFDDR